jgi:hypothetical protein
LVYVSSLGSLQIRELVMNKVCDCKDYCLDSLCVSSDSGLVVGMCWCAECSARCVEIKCSAFKVKEWSGCVHCGDTNDLSARFSRIPVCGKCARKNYRKAVGR